MYNHSEWNKKVLFFVAAEHFYNPTFCHAPDLGPSSVVVGVLLSASLPV